MLEKNVRTARTDDAGDTYYLLHGPSFWIDAQKCSGNLIELNPTLARELAADLLAFANEVDA